MNEDCDLYSNAGLTPRLRLGFDSLPRCCGIDMLAAVERGQAMAEFPVEVGCLRFAGMIHG